MRQVWESEAERGMGIEGERQRKYKTERKKRK